MNGRRSAAAATGCRSRSVDVRVSRLRRKLEDDPQNPRLIKTVYGAGYLFCATVSFV